MPHQVKPLLYPSDALGAISQKALEIHHDKLYAGYVNKRNEIEGKLATQGVALRACSNHNYSDFRSLKLEEVFIANAQILHELYFEGMAPGEKGKPSDVLMEKITEDFGSLENFLEDLKATGLSSRGWAVAALDPEDNKLHNLLMDFHSHGAIWQAKPIIVLDVYEHAYMLDFGTDKKTYIEAWSKLINWDMANKLFSSPI